MTSALLDTSKIIVGQSGSGKTVTAKADVQQLLEARRHVAIIDPTGVWWGMRSTAAGDGPGFDIPIFGGEHGDVPIRPTDGAAIARIIVEQRVSAIVDLSSIDNSRDWRIFVRDFVAELRRKPKANFHLVVDEADEFAQQQPVDDVAFALRENMIWMAKRGRVQGFVPTYITQRTAEIANAVISQAQTIVAHQLILPADQKVIDNYLKGHGSPDVRKAVMASLAELEVGERWVYSPRLKVLDRGITPALTTFDSSRTPAPGEQLVKPRTLAQLDVTAIRSALTPAAADLPDDTIPADAGAAYEKGSAVGGMIVDRDRRIAALEAENAELRAEVQHLRDVDAECDGYNIGLTAIEELVLSVRSGTYRANLHLDDADPQPRTPSIDVAAFAAAAKTKAGATIKIAGPPVPRGGKALASLAGIYPAALSEAQWATLAGYAKTGGTWGTYKGALRAAGHVAQDAAGHWQATEAGLAAAGVSPAPLPDAGADRARFWGSRVPGTRKLVDILVKRWPHFTTRDSLAADAGMAASGGTFGTYLGRLRANGLIEEQGKRVRLATKIMGQP